MGEGETEHIYVKRRDRYALAVLLILITFIMVYLFRQAALPWDPANVVPYGSVFAVGIDLNSTQQKMDALKTVRGISKTAGLDSDLNRLWEEFHKLTGLDISKDILPLTNKRAIIAVTSLPDDNSLPVVIAIGAKDDYSAIKLRDKILQTIEKNGILSEEVEFEHIPFTHVSISGVDGYLGIVSQAVVFAFDQTAAKDTAETSSGWSLTQEPMYKKASKRDPSVAVFTYEPAESTLTGLVFLLAYCIGCDENGISGTADDIRCSWTRFKVDGDSIIIEHTWKMAPDVMYESWRGSKGLSALLDAVPADSSAFIGLGGWGAVRSQLSEVVTVDPANKEMLGKIRNAAKQTIGLDLIDDIAQQSEAFGSFWFPSKQRDPLSPSSVVLIVKPKDMSVMESYLVKAREAMVRKHNSSIRTENISGYTVNFTAQASSEALQWTDAIVGDLILVSLDRKSVERAVSHLAAKGKSLRESADLEKVRRLLPKHPSALACITPESMSDVLTNKVPDEYKQITRRILSRTDSLVVGAAQTYRDTGRVVAVVRFKK